MGPHRKIGWESRLAAYLESIRQQPFARGEHDCVFFVAGAVNAQCETHHGDHLRGTFSTGYGASRLLYRLLDGQVSLPALFDRYLGRTARQPWQRARRGDPVVFRWQGSQTAGLVSPRRHIYAVTAEGLTELPLTPDHCWSLH